MKCAVVQLIIGAQLLAGGQAGADGRLFRVSRQFTLDAPASNMLRREHDADARAREKFPMTWVLAIVGVGVLVGAAVGALVVVFTQRRQADGAHADAESSPEARAAEAMAAAVASERTEEKSAMDYHQLMQLIMQKASATAGPVMAKSDGVRAILENTMKTFPEKAKSCVLNELNSVSAGLFAAVEAEEACLVLDWNEAITANLPPVSVLLAGLCSPTFLVGGASHNSTQVLFMLLPTALLCIWAMYWDWGVECSIPTLKYCVSAMAILTSLLSVVRLVLSIQFASGLKLVKDKVAEMEKRVAESTQEGGLSEARELFVAYAVVMQKAILEEQRVRMSPFSVVATILTFFMVFVQMWNAVLVLGWTFVPGTVAFHPGAKAHAGGNFCGAWACVLAARLACLVGVLFFVVNFVMLVEGISSILVAFSGAYSKKVLDIAKGIDKRFMDVPVCQTLAKAFILRGTSETSRAQLAVTLQEQNNLKTEKAEAEARLATINLRIAALTKDCDDLNAKVNENDGRDIEESMENLESGAAFADDVWKTAGRATIGKVQSRASDVQDASTKDLERLVEKVTETIDQIRQSDTVKSAIQQTGVMAEFAAEKARQTCKRLQDSGIMEELLEKAQMGMTQIQEAAANFKDPAAAIAMLQNAQDVINSQLHDNEAVQAALKQITQMADDLQKSDAGAAGLEQIMHKKQALEAAMAIREEMALEACQQVLESGIMEELASRARMDSPQIKETAALFEDPQAVQSMLQNAQQVIRKKLYDREAVQAALNQVEAMAKTCCKSDAGGEALEQLTRQKEALESALEITKEQAQEATRLAEVAQAEVEQVSEMAAGSLGAGARSTGSGSAALGHQSS